ncbi:PdaC/SigV domain-containing protein [Paenibacillus thailandensis]|uniref:PdaC/SigV domain-containing protein n=1 Tax=Paenibacillus thailandensis TaxID=393250 RepID=A0ABW5QZ70_9BACL
MKSSFKQLTFAIAGGCLLAAAVPSVSAVHADGAPAVSAVPISAETGVGAAAVTSKAMKEQTEIYNVDIQLPVVSGLLDMKYQEQLNAAIERQAEEDLQALKKQAAEGAAAAKEGGYDYDPYEMKVTYEIKSAGGGADGGTLSLTVQSYFYTGGAHGMTRVDTYNAVNGATAETITLDKALGSGYKAIAEKAVKAAAAAEPDVYFADAAAELEITNDHPFYVKDGDVYLVFQPYEIAPYAAGIVEIKAAASDSRPGQEPAFSVRVVPEGKQTGGEPAYLLTGHGDRLLPLRAVAEQAGYTVKWNQAARSAEVSKGASWTAVKPDTDYYVYNRTAPISLGIAPVMIDGTLYVPQTFFSDVLKLNVELEHETGALLIGEPQQ